MRLFSLQNFEAYLSFLGPAAGAISFPGEAAAPEVAPILYARTSAASYCPKAGVLTEARCSSVCNNLEGWFGPGLHCALPCFPVYTHQLHDYYANTCNYFCEHSRL